MPTVAISVSVSSPALSTIHQISAASNFVLFCFYNNVYYRLDCMVSTLNTKTQVSRIQLAKNLAQGK